MSFPQWELHIGDCCELLKGLDAESIDSIVTDPPYGIGFKGSKWDKYGKQGFKSFMLRAAQECLRALRPGSHVLVFGGTRTYHWMVDTWEEAGFEVRDTLSWLYGTGFPKSSNIAKQLDKKLGSPVRARIRPTRRNWDGWGTALKPAQELIMLARKPVSQPIYRNVLEYGTGGLNIDGCRVGDPPGWSYPNGKGGSPCHGGGFKDIACSAPNKGRWPANVILDQQAAQILDAQSGISKDGVAVKRNGKGGNFCHSKEEKLRSPQKDQGFGGEGGASRFFYCPKPSRKEKDMGLEPKGNIHPTVKPVKLLRYLARLITPPNGVILDPFCGSGTTGCAAVLESFRFVGCDIQKDYVEIARRRINKYLEEKVRGLVR